MLLLVAGCSSPSEPSIRTARPSIGSSFIYLVRTVASDGYTYDYYDTLTVADEHYKVGGREDVVMFESSFRTPVYNHYEPNGDISYYQRSDMGAWPGPTWFTVPLGSRGRKWLVPLVDPSYGDTITYTDTISYVGPDTLHIGEKVADVVYLRDANITLRVLATWARIAVITDLWYSPELGVLVRSDEDAHAFDPSGHVIAKGGMVMRRLVAYTIR